MKGRVLFDLGGPLWILKVPSQLVTVMHNEKRERNHQGRVHREVCDAVTETMCSPGQYNEALSRTMWFECTSDRKGERCSAPYASTHHIIFPRPWMRPSHRHPPLLSDSQSQKLSQQIFCTMQKKFLHRAEPLERFGLSQSLMKRELWVFSLITFNPLCNCKLAKLCLLQNNFCFCNHYFVLWRIDP